jgi:hypothetical protein
MNVVPIVPGSRGLDTDTPISASLAKTLYALKFDFVVRYLSDVTVSELGAILASGLGLALVTHARAPGWLPTEAMGVADGAADVAHLKALGVPPGMVLFVDLEGAGGSDVDTMAWANARSKAIVDAGYIAGLYVGDRCVLSAQQLYGLPEVSRYWKAYNAGIPEVMCGFCMLQLFPPDQTVAGLQIDLDVAQSDYKSRLAMMLRP